MQIWKVHLCNQQLASSFLLKDGWIRHQSRSAHSAAKQNWCFLKIKIKSQSLNLFNRMTWGNLFWATCWLTSIRTRRSGAGKQKMFQFVFYQGGGGDLSLLMWLRGRVWAFFFPQVFPPQAPKWQLRQDTVSVLPPLLACTAMVGKCQSNTSAFCFTP